MLNFETGRKLTILGFLGYAVIQFVEYFAMLSLYRHGSYGFYRFLNILGALALIGIAGAFAIKFLAERNMLDFLTGGAIGVAGLIGLFGFSGRSVVGGIIITVICNAYLLGMALRERENNNQMLFLFFVGAFVISILLSFFYRLRIVVWLRLGIVYAIIVVIALACAFACQQNNK